MSLLSDYHKELGIKYVIESDSGFMTYYFVLPDECYIEDVYVIPEKRRGRTCFDMADKVSEHAKSVGCKYLTGSVVLIANNAESSYKMQISYGFRVLRKEAKAIFMIKDL